MKQIEVSQKLSSRRHRKEAGHVLVVNGAADDTATGPDKARNNNQIVSPTELFKPRASIAAQTGRKSMQHAAKRSEELAKTGFGVKPASIKPLCPKKLYENSAAKDYLGEP